MKRKSGKKLRKPEEIWRGWTRDVSDDLKEKFASKIPDEGYIVLFDTGDIVIMKSNEPLTKEQQRPINEILSKMWDNLPIEEKLKINEAARTAKITAGKQI